MPYLMMHDAVTAANLPATAKYVCFYTDGMYANGMAVRARCPHATYLSISVHGGIADCADCEKGAMSVTQTEQWVQERLSAGAHRPCVYASQDTWEHSGLKAGLAKYGAKIRRWIAAYPGTGANVPAGYDAHQYTDGGGKLDTSVCLFNFFDRPAPDPQGVASATVSFDLGRETWTHHALPGVVHWGPDEKWASAELQVCVGGKSRGIWRLGPMPWNAQPLGG